MWALYRPVGRLATVTVTALGEAPLARPVPIDERLNWRTSAPFLAFHLIPLATIWTGVSASAVVLAVVLYWVRIFFITAGYHRYFAHRSYRLSRPAQRVLAVGGTTTLPTVPLWWAAPHRPHHRPTHTHRARPQ